MFVLKVVLIFRNILPCKLWFSCYYPIFLNKFFPHFLWVADIVCNQNCFVFTFTNLIQIEEKTHVPVTIRFCNYVFNENIHSMYCFNEWDVSQIHLFYETQKLENMCLLSLEKKKKPLLAWFSVKFVMLPAQLIVLANWFACMPGCMSVISLTSLHLKAKVNTTIILSWELLYIKQVEVLFPTEETIVRSIRIYNKLGPSLSLLLLYEHRLWYIANQSGSVKETVSWKIGKNIEMLLSFICTGTKNRILIAIIIIVINSLFSVDKLKYIILIRKKI